MTLSIVRLVKDTLYSVVNMFALSDDAICIHCYVQDIHVLGSIQELLTYS